MDIRTAFASDEDVERAVHIVTDHASGIKSHATSDIEWARKLKDGTQHSSMALRHSLDGGYLNRRAWRLATVARVCLDIVGVPTMVTHPGSCCSCRVPLCFHVNHI